MLRNEEYTDRELLHIIDSVTDGDGLASAEDIAAELGVRASNGRSAGGKVATRLSWMRRFGMLERVDPRTIRTSRDDKVLWRITVTGHTIMRGKLTKTVQTALDNMDAGAQVLAMGELADRGYVRADPTVAAAVRRQYLHTIAQRRR